MAKKKTQVKEVIESVEPTYTTEPIKEITLIEKYQEGKNQSIAIRSFFAKLSIDSIVCILCNLSANFTSKTLMS